MAVFLPAFLIGAPIGYFTFSKVFNGVDYEAAKLCQGPPPQNLKDRSTSELLREYYPPRSGWAATAGTLVSMGVLGKLTFQPDTRHRLFFAKAPANADIRIVTLKLAMELIARCGVVFYGGAAGGAISGRLAVAGKKPIMQQQQ
ncbi:predicted protein [Lichtheimia corymbifera JMRC:FSU:9682]|uniref:Uncharacterized protein n=1 Tax=Lichtheimia corymbifera JMRC:FSU:9682 TaxID=1263082 RepID=A0A068S7M3_9FUNG|nr:predicted protein [Lichtheimia corymbifera JMRC:FSU:9682]